jgi:hypothetical protein
MAFKTAMMGCKIKYPHEDTLFVETNCYEYLFDWEISIVASYIPNQRKVGRDAISRLLARNDLPEHMRIQTEHNSRCYL